MYILLFLLVMALTGLTWSFSWYRTGFYRLFGVEVQQRKSGKASSSPHGKEKKNEHDGTKSDVSYTYWQQVYEELAKQNDGYKQITVSDGTATVAFGRLGNQRASDRYTFDPDNGTITSVDLYKDTENRVKYEAGYTRYTSETGAGHSPAYSILSPLWAVLLSR